MTSIGLRMVVGCEGVGPRICASAQNLRADSWSVRAIFDDLRASNQYPLIIPISKRVARATRYSINYFQSSDQIPYLQAFLESTNLNPLGHHNEEPVPNSQDGLL